MIPQKLLKDFESAFGRPASLAAQAPGRVNLIGEHTDYNGGFVLPAAIERRCCMAAAPSAGRATRLRSMNFKDGIEADLAGPLEPHPKARWANYILATAEQFRLRGVDLPPLDIAVWGDVPLGSGLSSSAAVEVCAASLFQLAAGTEFPMPEVATMAQAAEHSRFVGVQCGIMDQFISANARAGHALLLDCHTLDFRHAALDGADANIVIVNSMKKRGLVDSEYNQRRAECEAGLAAVRRLAGGAFETIRHIPAEVFESVAGQLEEGPRKRLRHNIGENARVHAMAEALARGDAAAAGMLLYEGHQSLALDYQVSCAELDAIVDIASRIDGVHGCRMTGAGFGGCCVALVRPSAVDAFRAIMEAEYREAFGKSPEILATRAAGGAGAAPL